MGTTSTRILRPSALKPIPSADRDPFKFRLWELAVIGAFSVAFAGSLYLYLADVPLLRRFVFGLEETANDRRAGVLKAAGGRVRRQRAGKAEFETIETGSILYYSDTIVTGSGARAEVGLDDGGEISLSDNTMVRLSFRSSLTLGGVARQTNIELVEGTLTGDSKGQKILVKTRAGKSSSLSALGKAPIIQKASAPVRPIMPASPRTSPTPAPKLVQLQPLPPPEPPQPPPEPKPDPVTARILTPPQGAILGLSPGSTSRQVGAGLGWRTNIKTASTRVRVFRVDAGKRERIADRVVQSQDGQAAITLPIDRPGSYEWVVERSSAGESGPSVLARSSFRVRPDFEGIELLRPSVGGENLSSNRADGVLLREFSGISLRWQGLPDARRYKVRIYRGDQEGKPALEKEVGETQYTFNRGKLLKGRFRYRVYALLPGGFIAKSRADAFEFAFLAPALVQPRNGELLNSRKAGPGGSPKSVLFTWEKTHFTDFYELEIALDPEFKNLSSRKRIRENFQAIPMPDPGTYYWRVRAISQKTSSAPSAPNTLIIQ
jgi:hypothetical protein